MKTFLIALLISLLVAVFSLLLVNCYYFLPTQTTQTVSHSTPPVTSTITSLKTTPSISSVVGTQMSSTPQSGNQPSFGGQAILTKCWSTKELEGTLADKKIIHYKHCPQSQPNCRKPSAGVMALSDNLGMVIPAGSQKILGKSIRSVQTVSNDKHIALTFDLCESAVEQSGYDTEIVNYLRSQGIKATFYAGGKWMQSHPTATKQLMADSLFEIGNHAWTHGNFRKLTLEEMQQQILWTQAQYKFLWEELHHDHCVAGLDPKLNQIPATPLTFRFPYGTCNQEALTLLAKFNLPAIQWNVVTADPSPKQSAKAIANIVLHQVQPGSIIVAHANGHGYHTAAALPLFIPKLIEQGYQFVTVSELLNSAQSIEAVETCYELRPGDNARYNKQFGKGTN